MRDECLVTGASGFIGKHLVTHLVADGVPVRMLPGHGAGTVPTGVTCGAVSRMGPDTLWDDAVAGVTGVVHLAGLAHGRERGDLDRLRRVNVDATLALARSARRAGVRRFLFVSSSGVHGNASRAGPLHESSPLRPETPYAMSKLEAEQGLMAELSGSATELVVVRPPLVYGAGAPGNPARLLRLLRTGLPLPFASINNRRSFVAVANLCAALVCCLQSPKAAGETFLVADAEVLSIAAFLRALGHRLGRPVWLLPCPVVLLRAGAGVLGLGADMERLVADFELDTSRIHERLGFSPPLPLATGLAAWIGR